MKSLSESEEMLRHAQAVAEVGSWFLDITTNKMTWSDETYRMFGVSQQTQLSFETFADVIHPDDLQRVVSAWTETLNNGTIYDIEHRILVEGRILWVRERAAIERDSNGMPLVAIGTVQEITKKKKTEDMMWKAANFDRLTNLPNRSLLFDHMSIAFSLATRQGKRAALLYADLDGFKAVNDKCGHRAGDQVLITVAKRWKNCVRETDTVARIGGDEFAILLVDLDSPEAAGTVANKLISVLDEQIPLPDGKSTQVGTSIGISIFPDNEREIDSMLADADEAMYESKAKGKNTYTFSPQKSGNTGEQDLWVTLTDDHYVGVSLIDEQHNNLIEVLNQISQAIHKRRKHEEIKPLFDNLLHLAKSHFENEQQFMEKYHCSGQYEHIREHEKLLNKLQFLSDKVNKGGEKLVLQTIKDWLVNHIDVFDKKLGDIVRVESKDT